MTSPSSSPLGWFTRRLRKGRSGIGRHRWFRPRLERLEDRRVLSSLDLVSATHPDWLSNAANGSSSVNQGAVSGDGRYVAFVSDASDLVPGLDTAPGVQNVYRFDRQTGEVLLVSVNKDGTGGGNRSSRNPGISADGSVLAFESEASNLHALDTDTYDDVFVRNVLTNTTHLVSVNKDGTASGNLWSYAPTISADGTVVAFLSEASDLHDLDTDTLSDVFARDLTTGTMYLVSVNDQADGSGNGDSQEPVVSADGLVVAFTSMASNLHALKTTDTHRDVFARDLSTGTTHLVSVNAEATGSGNGFSFTPVLSADGAVVAFTSVASNLHALDADSDEDIFARDWSTGTTHLVSVNTSKTGSGNGKSYGPVISADGSVVAFRSAASNLHALDTDTHNDIFARNLQTHTTHLVSVNAAGTGSGNGSSFTPTISADGSVVAFFSNASNLHALDTDTAGDIFSRNLNTNTTHLVSGNKDETGSGNGFSSTPVISADGAVIAFASGASNLVHADFNGTPDVFVHHTASASTALASRVADSLRPLAANGPSSMDAGAVSADGRYVAFVSEATDLVSGLVIAPGAQNVYRWDRQTGEVLLVSIDLAGTGSGNASSGSPVISADGSVVAFESRAGNLHTLDTDPVIDIFVRDLTTGTTHLVSGNKHGTGSGNGDSWDPAISADGSVVAFHSVATNLHALDTDPGADIYARNLNTNTTYLVSVNKDGDGSGDGDSFAPALSADGSVVAFESLAGNLHEVQTEHSAVFARDLTTNTTYLVSVNEDGSGSGNHASSNPAISADGSLVVFESHASNLHWLDTDANSDIFARDLTTQTTRLVSVNADGTGSGNGDSRDAVLSADGLVVAFRSSASNLHALDTDALWDVFARNLSTQTTHLVSMNKDHTGSGNGHSGAPAIRADGSMIVFASEADDLHPLDTDSLWDVFVRNHNADTTQLVSVNKEGTGSGNGPSRQPAISARGSVIVFSSEADDLVVGDRNGHTDVFSLLVVPPWQNPANRYDVNDDGLVSPLDVLVTINEINQRNEWKLPLPPHPSQSPPPYYDVSGDNWLTALDVLLIINYINASNAFGAGPVAAASPAVPPAVAAGLADGAPAEGEAVPGQVLSGHAAGIPRWPADAAHGRSVPEGHERVDCLAHDRSERQERTLHPQRCPLHRYNAPRAVVWDSLEDVLSLLAGDAPMDDILNPHALISRTSGFPA